LTRPLVLCLLTVALLFCLGLVKPVFANIPKVENVIAWKDGANTMLTVTIHHITEDSGHHVDEINVSVNGGIQSFPQNSPHLLDLVTFTFHVTIGPITGVTGTPTATVSAHCSVNGWSSQLQGGDWVGQIPEFSLPMLLVTMALVTFVFAVAVKKAKPSTID